MLPFRRRTPHVVLIALAAAALALVACNSSSEDTTASPTPSDATLASEVSASPTAAATLGTESLADATETATAEPTADPSSLATAEPSGECEPTTEGAASGSVTPVTVNNECLEPLFFAFKQNGGDPFWHLHTQQDNIFLSLELYTVYGPSWAGEIGTFPLDCNQPWGLCLLYDADGVGPIPIVMWGTGSITIDQLDEGGYDVTFNGTMPAAVDGTIYDILSTTWSGS